MSEPQIPEEWRCPGCNHIFDFIEPAVGIGNLEPLYEYRGCSRCGDVWQIDVTLTRETGEVVLRYFPSGGDELRDLVEAIMREPEAVARPGDDCEPGSGNSFAASLELAESLFAWAEDTAYNRTFMQLRRRGIGDPSGDGVEVYHAMPRQNGLVSDRWRSLLLMDDGCFVLREGEKLAGQLFSQRFEHPVDMAMQVEPAELRAMDEHIHSGAVYETLRRMLRIDGNRAQLEGVSALVVGS